MGRTLIQNNLQDLLTRKNAFVRMKKDVHAIGKHGVLGV